MDKNKFIENFVEQLEDHDGSPITIETHFRNLECWDSLTGTAVQLMIDDEYNASIPDDDFLSSKTIGDLYELALKHRN